MVSRDVMPNTVTFTILVDGLCKEGMVSEARRVFETMTEKGVFYGAISFTLDAS
jgi:pentatricopeptide repeat protein